MILNGLEKNFTIENIVTRNNNISDVLKDKMNEMLKKKEFRKKIYFDEQEKNKMTNLIKKNFLKQKFVDLVFIFEKKGKKRKFGNFY